MRLVMFAAMAGLLVAALCVPEAFGDLALTFAIAYGVVRAHIGLFVLASRGQPEFRRFRSWPGDQHGDRGRPAGRGLVLRRLDPGALWAVAIVLDLGGPYLFGAEGGSSSPSISPSVTG